MKKAFKYYSLTWILLLALFNVIVFVTAEGLDVEKFTESFWIGYGFITASFIGQIICSGIALNNNNSKKTFYKIPLVFASYTGLILSFVFGSFCILVPQIPYWVSIVLCSIVLVFNIIAVAKASAAASLVSGVDEKIKVKTFFIKSLTVDAESLISRAKSEPVKTECKKVYEAVRYSDPMSNDALAQIESMITVKFAKLSEAVVADNSELTADIAGEIIILIGDRNKKCQLLK